MGRCIFCLKSGDIFHTIEHIVPESLGNTDDILKYGVCDQCQNYFGREIERYVLQKTPVGFWRTIAGTLTKKGKPPAFNPTQNPKSNGKLPDYHPQTDSGVIIHPGDGETIIDAEFSNDSLFDDVVTGKKKDFQIVLTPKILVYLGRFLGKIALEYWYKSSGNDVFRKDFNELRMYVRNGTTKDMCPILHGNLEENLLIYRPKDSDSEERTLYAYRFFDINSLLFFCFDVGTERYSIILNQKYPPGELFSDHVLSALCQGAKGLPNIFYYDL